MARIVLEIEDQEKAQSVLRFLREMKLLKKTAKPRPSSLRGLKAIAGMWKDYDIDGRKLREEAWGR